MFSLAQTPRGGPFLGSSAHPEPKPPRAQGTSFLPAKFGHCPIPHWPVSAFPQGTWSVSPGPIVAPKTCAKSSVSPVKDAGTNGRRNGWVVRMSATCHPGQHGKQKQPQNIRTRWTPGAKESAAGSECTGCPWAPGPPAGVDGRGTSRHCTYRQADRLLLPSVHQVCQLLWPFVRGSWLPAGPWPRHLSLHLQEGACAGGLGLN